MFIREVRVEVFQAVVGVQQCVGNHILGKRENRINNKLLVKNGNIDFYQCKIMIDINQMYFILKKLPAYVSFLILFKFSQTSNCSIR